MTRYADALARGLQTIDDRGWTVDQFSLPVPKPLFTGRRKFFWRFYAYPWLAQFRQGDINHIVDHSYARAAKYLDLKKTIITCHDLIPLDYEKDQAALKIFKETISYLPKVAKIITVSEATKRDVVKRLKVPEEKVVVVHEGVGNRFQASDPSFRFQDQHQIPRSKRVILHVGNSLQYKNMEGLIKAFALVKKEMPDVVLVKVGRFTKDQSNLILNLNLKLDLNPDPEPDIFQLLDLSEEELIAAYNLADVTCIPSFKEGFGFPVLESMACGTPVVCSDTSSLPEVGGKAAFYCNPKSHPDIAKQLVAVLRSSDSNRESRIKSGLRQAKQFTWENTAFETLKVYCQISSMLR